MASSEPAVGQLINESVLMEQLLGRRSRMVHRSQDPHTRARWLPLVQWVNRLDPSRSVLVQVGANDHSGGHDPAPTCVARGWQSLLVEPVLANFERLQRRYKAEQQSGRVRLLNAAICGTSCDAGERRMWSVDSTNATGHWGTNHSDTRCAATTAPWISEIASLSRWHVLNQAKLLKCMCRVRTTHTTQLTCSTGAHYTRPSQAARHRQLAIVSFDVLHLLPVTCSTRSLLFTDTPSKCRQCTALLRREFPPDCLSQVVVHNLVSQSIPCRCLRNEVHAGIVSLLMIDAEGSGASHPRRRQPVQPRIRIRHPDTACIAAWMHDISDDYD